MREVVTADAIVRALAERGKRPKFIYIADTFDPLRRVYPFLDAETYKEHVGKPLSEIPCPCGNHESYAEHFLEPFIKSLQELDIQVEILRVDRLYKEGEYEENILRAIDATDKIRAILKDETGRDTGPEWSPFQPICQQCGKLTGSKVSGLTEDRTGVRYTCDCGGEGTASLRGGGKLTWRVDWPARWQLLGVTIEPFGKDHASKGGSYDTGVRIIREVFNAEPPFPIVYEWIGLRGGGDMSSSKGNVLSIANMLEVVPPDVLKYAVVKPKPNRRLVFDPGLPLLTLVDEYDDPTSAQRHQRAAELAHVTGTSPVGAPFRHMVSLVQITQDRPDEITRILRRNGYNVESEKVVASRAKYARRWLEKFAPEDVRFTVQENLPAEAKDLSEEQKKALRLLAEKFKDNMNAEEVHTLIYGVKEEAGLGPAQVFQAIYKAILGKTRGPRAGFFLASLDAEFVRRRLQEAASA